MCAVHTYAHEPRAQRVSSLARMGHAAFSNQPRSYNQEHCTGTTPSAPDCRRFFCCTYRGPGFGTTTIERLLVVESMDVHTTRRQRLAQQSIRQTPKGTFLYLRTVFLPRGVAVLVLLQRAFNAMQSTIGAKTNTFILWSYSLASNRQNNVKAAERGGDGCARGA